MHIIRRITQKSTFHWVGLSLLAGILLPLLCMRIGYARAHAQDQRRLSPISVNSTPLSVEQAILNNIKQNGFDSSSKINNGLGGLWLNWVYGSNPLQTNFNGSGNPDGPKIVPPRHDQLTDVRYLHALWLYKSQNPSDIQYDSEIARYTAIVKHEFASTGDMHGWLFDEEFMDLYHLSNDPSFQKIALSLVSHYSQDINSHVGIIYQANKAHPYGFYRPDLVLEQGCALIQAGTQFQNSQWVQQGKTMINFAYAHAYITQYHAFPDQLDRVLQPGGAVNSAETFYIDNSQHHTIYGNLMKMGSTAQIVLSLLHTYQATQNADFLNKAIDLLNPLTLPANSLGMWDTTYSGYYYQVQFGGSGPQAPGSLTVYTSKKEAGRQETMLWAFHLANLLTNNKYANMEAQMQTVALTKAYYAPGQGVLAEVSRQWTPVLINKQPENWVTTEAMDIELEALLETN